MALRIESERFGAWARLCTESLAVARDEIDALNVFPVPDSDTGTNAYFTFVSGVEAIDALPAEATPLETMRAFAEGLLMGARGNCGTILAELVRGSLRVLRGCVDGLSAEDVAEALGAASAAAYAAVGRPQEGTILTVAAAAARAARAAAATDDDPKRVFDEAAGAAREALALTPTQFEKLARAGVVDAGGRALVVVLDSVAFALTGRVPSPRPATVPVPLIEPGSDLDEDGPAYEVMFLLRTPDERIPALREALEPLGDCLVVVGGEGLWNVHVHVDDVGAAIEAGIGAGSPFQISVTHFADQIARATPVTGGRVIISAVTGPGLADLTRRAGGTPLLFGPDEPLSVATVAEAIRDSKADEVICLPNRSGHIAMFEAAAASARDGGARVAVLPTTVQVQALTALAVHDPGRPFDVVVVAMSNAAGATRHGAITIAAEDGITMAGPCRAGDVLGVVNGDFAIIGASQADVAYEILQRLDLATAEMVTLVLGRDCEPQVSDELAARVRRDAPHVDVEVLEGDQGTYSLFLAVE
ncbi:DAK2 domain-containing protein [Aeromicrobium sp. 636]|uniref:DAK2 domain-containing protein n=1 Tax=Aeromicrobium senzhongii TaxID=2663859 RepID=A0A8I0ESX2_9ACTN|nr:MULTISPECIES: DAK2 domain-containing protein [Aeromicrobium]MBC9225585.1 DAK2 domain-containing protein [Aeromicrobium senzhongii]MCQ3997694.1 DAK2 domain-containing protein [Aeromicrobium sp. 636]